MTIRRRKAGKKKRPVGGAKKALKRSGKIARLKRTPPAKAPAPEEAAPPARTRIDVACICGQLLRLRSELAGRRGKCPSCERRFMVTFEKDPDTGEQIAAPLYITETISSGDTAFVESIRKSEFQAPPPDAAGAEDPAALEVSPTESDTGERTGTLDTHSARIVDDLLPEPPRALYFLCPCGEKLLARQGMYDRRVRCPHCQTRLLISLVYDDAQRRYDIQPVRLSDDVTGDTALLDGP